MLTTAFVELISTSDCNPVPIIGSALTPVVVFLPLTLLTGVTGVFFRSLALTISAALLTSLVLALAFTPVLAERFVRAKPRTDEAKLDG